MRILVSIIAIGVSLAMFQAGPSSAHLRGHRDPNDTAEADLRWVSLEKVRHGRIVIADVRIWGIEHPQTTIFSFDTRDDRRTDYYLRVRFDGASFGIFEAKLYRADWSPTSAEVRILGRLDVTDQGWFPVSFRWWRLHATRHIRWRVTSLHIDELLDRAPDFGWYRH